MESGAAQIDGGSSSLLRLKPEKTLGAVEEISKLL